MASIDSACWQWQLLCQCWQRLVSSFDLLPQADGTTCAAQGADNLNPKASQTIINYLVFGWLNLGDIYIYLEFIFRSPFIGKIVFANGKWKCSSFSIVATLHFHLPQFSASQSVDRWLAASAAKRRPIHISTLIWPEQLACSSSSILPCSWWYDNNWIGDYMCCSVAICKMVWLLWWSKLRYWLSVSVFPVPIELKSFTWFFSVSNLWMHVKALYCFYMTSRVCEWSNFATRPLPMTYNRYPNLYPGFPWTPKRTFLRP